MTETTATTRKKTTTVAAKPDTPKSNWHSTSGIKVCPECGEPRHTDNDGNLFCPAGKGECAFVKIA